MKLKKLNLLMLQLFCCIVLTAFFTACDEDELDQSSTPSTSNEVTPVVKIITDASTKDSFTVAFRVKSVSQPNVTLSWGVYSQKNYSPNYSNSGVVTKTYDVVKLKSSPASEYYYKVEHVGFTPGSYVYYKIDASNSKGNDTKTGYVIIKR